ncbi:MAG TPA: WD40 repeat domain-containing serine/threonine protein kinase [Anaerolineales bacterium]|nr:WD40 repeat domain-containing serine/threonine protein kinase [Anaerolineales bacterium]
MAIPEKIGRYEIKEELGRGGFATVYRAYDPRFEREVAIKFLPSELMHSDPQFRMRFQREAKIIAQLEHPSIVPVYDVGAENEQPYFVMRYMSGGSLSERIKARTYTIEEAVKIIENLAPGLDEAHAKNIVHRDLKPANILFTEKNVPLIADFGIAKFTQGDSTVDNMTGSAIIGTPAYMAPEQASGEAVDGRVDIYALGVILYEMVTGKQPYTADTPLGLAIKHVTEPVPRILEANPNLPVWMEKVISTAMAKNPDDRFYSAVELVETIKAFLRGENPQINANVTKKMSPYNSTATFKRTKTAEPKRRNWVVPALVSVGFLAVAGVCAFALVSSGMLQSLLEPVVTPTIAATSTISPATEVTETSEAITATVEVPPTENVPSLPLMGGADKIAFIKNNDIWVMNVDGSELKQHTNDGLPKFNLQWMPDGKNLLYMTGKTVKTVNIDTEVEEVLMNFVSAEYFEGFSVSPNGKQAAISINRELFIVPFEIETLRAATRKSALLEMKGCFYNDLGIKELQWSDDSTKLAVEFIANSNGSFADAIRVYDVQDCEKISNSKIDEFPAGRFQFSGDLSSFDWDGDLLFFLTSNTRNGGFGDLALYNIFTHKAEKAAPYESNCCYRDAAFSPDGTQVIFAFQDIRLAGNSPINLYIIPADSISTPRKLEPILPMDFFTKRDEAPQPVMRAAQP